MSPLCQGHECIGRAWNFRADFCHSAIRLLYFIYISAYRGNTSIALATILSLMLASFVQFAISVIQGVPVEMGWVVSVFGVRPSIATSTVESYRFITSAWIHAGWIHVLGNILVIGLVGIPLEQRMGGKRWMTVYILGLWGKYCMGLHTS